MNHVVITEKKPIKLWLNAIEDGALEQAKNLANLPFIHSHVAIMPDSHLGYGMPIGGVIATEGVVIPNAVGVDIGCGVQSVKTSLKELDLKRVMAAIRRHIPLGFKHHKVDQDFELMPAGSALSKIVDENYYSALKQLGTLGGGNHFIEIQKGDDGFLYIMIHSGSRNLGYKVAKYYNDLATSINELYRSSVPKEWGLAFLPLNTKEGQDYMKEMRYCVQFAQASRSHMMKQVMLCIQEIVAGDLFFNKPIDIAHNYAAMENHFGKNVLVHRKGATRAREGGIGLIPGSQGTSSFIVKGRGNADSFCSCSHGAGRVLSRTKAKVELKLEEQQALLDKQGIMHSIRSAKDLDEAPGAYKDIHTVMENQSDLVEIVTELKPLAVIKG